METIVKDLVNLGIGAVKKAEEKSGQLMQETRETIRQIITTGEGSDTDRIQKLRNLGNEAAGTIAELQQQAEKFVSSIIGRKD